MLARVRPPSPSLRAFKRQWPSPGIGLWRLAAGAGEDFVQPRQDVGGETEHVAGDYQGEDLTIAFNSRYLNDGVAAVEEDQVVLDVIDPLKPGVLRGAESREFLYLLMPVRL